ncbi:MAG: alpha/beta hydrolase [Neisseriaceae bacterium]|nr:MAG: alpha/beta hydrolase [Neisseriaceae bacterium]
MRSYKLLCVGIASILLSNVYAATIVSNEYNVPYSGGQTLHLKEKRLSTILSGKVIVLINPLSIPALSAFDVPGYSLMDALAAKGYDVWGIDFTGEGSASYPPSMSISPAPQGVYPLEAKDAVKELKDGVDYIVKKTGKKSVDLLGWSWGSVVAAMYSIQHPKQVNHLVLYGSMYSSKLAESIQPIFIKPFESPIGVFSQNLPAYQNIPWKVINTHWNMMLESNPTIASESAINAVGKIYVNADPKPVMPTSLRRPMGPMKDLFAIWNAQPIYDINKLTTPTLVIYGDQDLFADHELYSKLANVKTKQEIVLKEATHWLIYEKARAEFVDDVAEFLNK